MAFVTYTLLSTMLAGLHGQFHPELLGGTAGAATLCVGVEILALKLACYLLAISNDSQVLDLIAYSGYKFVGIIVTTLVGEIGNRGAGTGGWIGWTVFLYTWFALAFFLVSNHGRLDTFTRPSLTNSFIASVDEIRPSSRLPECRWRFSIATQPADAVFVHLLVRSAIRLHVAA